MCTVTFVPRRGGYCLAMNRDEQLTRAGARPPRREKLGDRTVIWPADPGGGTWIALNDTAACLALLNWYAVPGEFTGEPVTRGRVVQTVGVATRPAEVATALGGLPLARMKPFRLVGVFPASAEVVEWRWDAIELVCRRYAWQVRQWASSGFDERTAQRGRKACLSAALRQRSAGTLSWLRRLHRSHLPERGPLSTCMHRSDAATVSYTEVSVDRRRATMRYLPGPPCGGARGHDRRRCTLVLLPGQRPDGAALRR